MGRLDYQRVQAIGTVLDIGAGEQNLNGLTATRIDRTDYGVLGQLVGDANALPFEDKSFDSAILGDILEHVEDPLRVLAEAVRVARKRVILTIPKDTRFPPGQHVEAARALDADRLHPTINCFDEAWLRSLVAQLPVEVLDWRFVPECDWMNWLITLGVR